MKQKKSIIISLTLILLILILSGCIQVTPSKTFEELSKKTEIKETGKEESANLCGNQLIDEGETCSNCQKDVKCSESQECIENECKAKTISVQCSECQYRVGSECFSYACCNDAQCNDSNSGTEDKCINAETTESYCANITAHEATDESKPTILATETKKPATSTASSSPFIIEIPGQGEVGLGFTFNVEGKNQFENQLITLELRDIVQVGGSDSYKLLIRAYNEEGELIASTSAEAGQDIELIEDGNNILKETIFITKILRKLN